mmetsp:Transcript_35213/g.78900  ORF Transcript_35213/g.78900 Transcript_35213/m.78900 type:complete len:1394 (-) Transcript_35213:89-4270(-)
MRLLLSAAFPLLASSQDTTAETDAATADIPRCTIEALTAAEDGLKKVVQRVNKAKRYRDLDAAIEQADSIGENPLLEGCFIGLEYMIATGPVNITDPQSTECPVECPNMYDDEDDMDGDGGDGGDDGGDGGGGDDDDDGVDAGGDGQGDRRARRARRRLQADVALPAACNVSSPDADPCCLDGEHPTKCCLPRAVTWQEADYPTGVDAGMVYAMCEGVSAENLQKIGELVKALVQRLKDMDSGVAVQKCKARKTKKTTATGGTAAGGAAAGGAEGGAAAAVSTSARDVCYKILSEGLTKNSAANCKKNTDCFGVLDATTGKEKPGKCLGNKQKKCFYDPEMYAEYVLPCVEAKMSDTEMRWLKKSVDAPSNAEKTAFFTAFKAKVLKETCVGSKSMRYPKEECYEEMMLAFAELELSALVTEMTEEVFDEKAEAIFTMCDPKPIGTKEACLAQKACNWGESLDDCPGMTAAERKAYGYCKPVTAKECAQGPRVDGAKVYKQDQFFCDYQGIDAGAWDSTRRTQTGCERGLCTVAPEVQTAAECTAIKFCTVDCLVGNETFPECATDWVENMTCAEAVYVKEDALWTNGTCAYTEAQATEYVEAWKTCDAAACACADKEIPAGTFVTEDGTALADCAAVKEAGGCDREPDATSYYCPVTCDSCAEADAADAAAARRQRRLQKKRRLGAARKLKGGLRGRKTQEDSGDNATAVDDGEAAGDDSTEVDDGQVDDGEAAGDNSTEVDDEVVEGGDDGEEMGDDDLMLGACPASQFFGCAAADKILSDFMGAGTPCATDLAALEAEHYACWTAPVFKGDALCTSHGYCWENDMDDFDGGDMRARRARRLSPARPARVARRAQDEELGDGEEAGEEAESGMTEGGDDEEDWDEWYVKPSTDKTGCEGSMQCEEKANFTEATCTECGMDYSAKNLWEGGEIIQGEFVTDAADGAPVWRAREFAAANKFVSALDFESFFGVFDSALVSMDAEDVATEIECLMAPILNEMKQLVCLCDKSITEGDVCKATIGAPAKVASKTVFAGTAVKVSAGSDSGVQLATGSLTTDAKVEISTISAEAKKSGEVSAAQNAAFSVVGTSKRAAKAANATTTTTAAGTATTAATTTAAAADTTTTAAAADTTTTAAAATTTAAAATTTAAASGGTRRLATAAAPSACGYNVVYNADEADPSAQLGSDGYAYNFGGASLAAAAPLCIARKSTIPLDACKYSVEKPILAKMDDAGGKIKKHAAATLTGSSYCANVQDSGTYYLAFEGPGTASTDCAACEASKIAEVGATAAAERNIKVETAAQAAARETAAKEAAAAAAKAKAEQAVAAATTTTTTKTTTTTTTKSTTVAADTNTTAPAAEDNATTTVVAAATGSSAALGLLAPLGLVIAVAMQ